MLVTNLKFDPIVVAKLKELNNTQKGWSLQGLVREEVVNKLLLAQSNLCAYCECRIYNANMHIEHVVERHDRPELTYNPDNFVLSCEGGRHKVSTSETQLERESRVVSISCGHYKTDHNHTSGAIDHNLFINPREEDLYESVHFIGGVMEASHKLTPEQAARVNYTIDRLNLNSLRLVYARRYVLESMLRILHKYSNKSSKKRFLTMLMKDKEVKTPFYSFIRYNLPNV